MRTVFIAASVLIGVLVLLVAHHRHDAAAGSCRRADRARQADAGTGVRDHQRFRENADMAAGCHAGGDTSVATTADA